MRAKEREAERARQALPSPSGVAAQGGPGPHERALQERQAARRTVAVLLPAIFVADLILGPEYGLAGLYILPLSASLWLGSARAVLGVACTSAGLGLATPLVHAWGWLRPPGDAPIDWVRVGVHLAWALFALAVVAQLLAKRITTERALSEARALHDLTLRSIAEAVVASDARGRVSFLNRAAEKLCGWDRAEAEGRPLAEVVRLSNETQEQVEGADERVFARARLCSRNGSEVPVLHSREAIRDTDGATRGEVWLLRDDTERRDYERGLLELAYRDALTGLPNRASLADRLELELAHARRQKRGLALLFLDLDGFKAINDTRGHAAGDALLVGAAQHLTHALREGDTVARLGGDEFTAILPGIEDEQAARIVGEKLLRALERPIEHEGELLRVRGSVGLALYPRDGADATSLLQQADAAMYRAKADGGGRLIGAQPASEQEPSSSAPRT